MKDYYKDLEFKDLPEVPNPLGDRVEVNIFVDASHADNKLNRKSVTGILIYGGDMLVKSISRRQNSVDTSTFSSEYLALKTVVEEVQGMRLLVQSIVVPSKGTTNVHSDSKSLLKSAENPEQDLKHKDVAISYSLVRENIIAGIIRL